MGFMIATLGAFEDSLSGELLVHTAIRNSFTSPLALERILTTPLPLCVQYLLFSLISMLFFSVYMPSTSDSKHVNLFTFIST